MSNEQYPEIECAPPESSEKPIAGVNQAKVDIVVAALKVFEERLNGT